MVTWSQCRDRVFEFGGNGEAPCRRGLAIVLSFWQMVWSVFHPWLRAHALESPGFACIRSAWRPAWFGLMRVFPPFPAPPGIANSHWSLVRDQGSGVRAGNFEPGVRNHQPPSTNHQPPTTKHQAPSTKHQAPSTKHKAPSTKHQPPTTNHQAPSTNHQPPSTNHQPPSTKHKAQSTKHQAPSTKHKAQSTKHRPTGHRPPLVSDPRVQCRCPPCFGEAEREEKLRVEPGCARWSAILGAVR